MPTSKQSSPRTATRRRRTPGSVVFTIASVIVHLVVFGAVVLLTPLREAFVSRTTDEGRSPVLSAERLEDAAEDILDINREEIEEIVGYLREILDEMAMQEEASEGHYETSLDELAATAAESALVDQTRALQAQKRALENQKKLESSPRPDAAESGVVAGDQTKARQAQDDVKGRFDVAAPDVPDSVKSAQAKATADQVEADRAQAKALSAAQELGRIEREVVTVQNNVRNRQTALHHATTHRANAAKWLDTARRNHESALKNVRAYEGHLAQRKRELEVARKAGKNLAHSENQVKSTIRSLEQRQRIAQQAAARVDKLKADLEKRQLALKAAQTAAAETESKASGLQPSDMEKRKAQVKAARVEATRLQQAAIESQTTARDVLAKHLAEMAALAAEGPLAKQDKVIAAQSDAVKGQKKIAERPSHREASLLDMIEAEQEADAQQLKDKAAGAAAKAAEAYEKAGRLAVAAQISKAEAALALKTARKAQQDARNAQVAAADKLKKQAVATTRPADAQAKADASSAQEEMKNAADAQAKALALQDAIAQSAAASRRSALDLVAKKQQDAKRTQGDVGKTMDSADLDVPKQVASAQTKANATQASADGAQNRARQAWEEAQTRAASIDVAIKAAIAAEHAVSSAEKALADAKNAVNDDAAQTDEIRKEISRREGKLADARQAAKQAHVDVGRKTVDLANAKTQADKALASAMEAQDKALASQTAARDDLAGHFKELNRAARKAELASRDQRPSDPTLDRKYSDDLVGAYRKAGDLEKAIAEAYGRIKAYELATHLKTSFERAQGEIDLPMPSRPGINTGLLKSTPKTASQFQKQTTEVRNAVNQARSMASASGSWRDQVLHRESALAKALAAAAHEVSGGKDSDLTGLMRQAGGRRAKNADAKSRGSEGSGGKKDPRFMNAGQRQSGPPTPESIRRIYGAKPARVFGAGGGKAEWVYIDTWYTLGPFPNPKRVNIHRKFPPESGVDLGARYPGGKHGTLKWKFVQGNVSKRFAKHDPTWKKTPIAMVPADDESYGVWYAYTEVVFDRDRDVWIAVGNDDRSDIWINGLPVWHSSDELKGWRVNEARRRVRFRKGTNEILYRLENGWYETVFSFCIHLGTPEP